MVDPSASRWSNARVALVLGLACGVATVMMTPYALAAVGGTPHTMGLPLPVAYAIGGLQNAIVCFLLAWAGLRLAAPLGLDAPLVRAWTSRQAFAGARHWLAAAAIGAVAGGAIVALDAIAFGSSLSTPLPHVATHPTRLQGALASFYGGIAEEVQVRLFFMTAIAWCLAKVSRSKGSWVFVTAVVVASVAFGAGHLPFAAQVLGPLTAPVVVRVILLNALAGLAFGALYWRWGLEHAMVAHFCADLVLHVVVGG
jgi:Type II CAAX prenyl endopeptidase Rce1-like